MEDFLIVTVIFAVFFGIIYVLRTASHKEKMAIIEKGMDPEMFRRQYTWSKYNTFKYGMFLVGVSLGIVFAQIIIRTMDFDEVAAHFAGILFFGGLALIITFLLQKRLTKE